jgi:hypothetical protein
MRITEDRQTVKDRLWIWGHPEGSYNGPQWGLPGNSRITPLEAAAWMGIPNIILIHYGDEPKAPLSQYAIPLESASKVMWSVVGGGGRTNAELQAAVFDLAHRLPNLVGLFMDDFFHFRGNPKAQWLAPLQTELPIELELDLGETKQVSRVELGQSDAPGGKYRTAEFTVSVRTDLGGWMQVGGGKMPNAAGELHNVSFEPHQVGAVRISILGTHDTGEDRGCGFTSIRLYNGGGAALPLDDVELATTSRLPHKELTIEERMAIFDGRAGEHWADYGLCEPRCILDEAPAVAASLTPSELAALRTRTGQAGQELGLGVALYDYQLSAPSVVRHLDLVDLVVLWHWQPKDLHSLPVNLSRLRELVPDKRLMIGCYMWDFHAGRELPIELMEYQCTHGLDALRSGEIDGIVFLASNLCDLDLSTVRWTKDWIARNGDASVP